MDIERLKYSFRNYEALNREPSCQKVNETAWQSFWNRFHSFMLLLKITNTRRALLDWKQKSFGSSQSHLNKLNQSLQVIRNQTPSHLNHEKEASIQL